MFTYYRFKPLAYLLGIFLVAGVIRLLLVSTAQWSFTPINYKTALIQVPEVVTLIVVPLMVIATFALLMAHVSRFRKEVWYEGYLIKLWRERNNLIQKNRLEEESEWAFSNLARDPDPLVIPPRRYVSVVWRSIATLMIVVMVVLMIVNLSNRPQLDWIHLGLGAVGCAALGFSEEVLFRGVILSLARKIRCSEVTAALLTTFLYTVWYLGNIGVDTAVADVALYCGRALLTGIAFYALRRTFGRLSVAIWAHAIWDFTILVLAP